jgi:chemotaxis protein CheX
MNKIILYDCSQEVTDMVNNLFGKKVAIENSSFDAQRPLQEFRMVIVETGSKKTEQLLQEIKALRYACNFRNIPIIVMKKKGDTYPNNPYLMAGATEILSWEAPPLACRQILQGYLIPNRKPLDQEMEYLTPFIDSTKHILKTMTSMDAEYKELYFPSDFRIFGDVSGIVGLSGKAEGNAVITFCWDLARKVISHMMRVTEDQINAEFIHDGVGELINMISGFAKKSFVGKPYHFELSIPTVVMGSGHQIGHPEEASIALLIFDVEKNSFALQVCLKLKTKKSN